MRWVFAGALLVACGGSSTGTDPTDAGAAGTGASSGSGGSGVCVPNQQVACACGGNQVGYQICMADGSGFHPCVCPDAGAGGATGGAAGTAGAGGVSGASGSGGAAGSAGCPSTMKYCSGVCVSPNPSVGCSLASCTPCVAPPHSGATCSGSTCDFICDAGYEKSGSLCFASSGGGGSGGTGGTGGSGGTGSFCNVAACPSPAPPAVKCCVTSKGPCGIDYQQGAGCQVPVVGGAGGTGGIGGFGGVGGSCPSTKPTTGTACAPDGLACGYGSSLCFCLSTWGCN